MQAIADQEWDYIVIGTGISGGTIGYALAKTGAKVLFLEKGRSRKSLKQELIAGEFPEAQKEYSQSLHIFDKNKILSRGLRSTSRIIDSTDTDNEVEFTPLLGEGVGGSSTIYGAVLERFFPQDFNPTKYYSNCPGANVVDWPIQYEDLEVYYKQAESLYQVFGSVDPNRKKFQSHTLQSRKLSQSGEKIFSNWQRHGLKPYLLPVAHPPNYLSECPGCQAVVCSTSDKKGSYEICIEPALEKYNAVCLEECEVTFLEAENSEIKNVHVLYQGKKNILKGKKIILSAGALFSPALLLNSKSLDWPNGLANSSGMVGKNLCRHFLDLALVKVPLTSQDIIFEKELALNDFYFSKNLKLGTVQSLGRPPHFLSVLGELNDEKKYHGIFNRIYLLLFQLIGRPIYNFIMRSNVCLALIMEDVPYLDNRIEVDSERNIHLFYHIRSESIERLKIFKSLVKSSLAPYKTRLHKQAQNNQRLAHASGTCRMGSDPAISVVDLNCKSHDIHNLYIIDASFFPSSAGINPALTLAANALRVAEKILNKFTHI